jgi:poly(hydroxyalkanoate) granule-associated protein
MATKKTKKTKKSAGKPRTTRKAKKKGAKADATEKENWTWLDILRTPVLASVGAFSMAEEGIENFVKDLVERGETSEKDGKKIVEDFRKRTNRNRKDFEKRIDERIERGLKALRLPTKKDVDSLSRKIDKLQRRVEALSSKGK